MPEEISAETVLDAHQRERERPDAEPAHIVSVLVGDRSKGRQTFIAWCRSKNQAYLVAPTLEADALALALQAYPGKASTLLVPAAEDLLAALFAAWRLSRQEPRRAVAIVLAAEDVEWLLTQESVENAPELQRTLIGGLVPIAGTALAHLAARIPQIEKLYYRSTHEEVLHKLMREAEGIGDIFGVNRRVRPGLFTGTYEIDFWCPDLKLAVEVDGLQHAQAAQKARDDKRDLTLSKHGIAVVRVHASKVLSDPTATLTHIAAAVALRRKEMQSQ